MRQHKYSPVLQAFTTCTSEQHFKNGKLLVFIKRRYGIIKDNQSDGYRTTREFVELEEDTPLTDASSDVISTLDICLPETLQALPEDERWLIEESDLNRRPQQSLADELGITLTAFKSRLLRARKHLKETMTELCQIEADDTSPVCCYKKMN